MSHQHGGILQTQASFTPTNTQNYHSQSIDSTKFSSWQAKHMYQSSYSNSYSKDSDGLRSTLIPGYAGYIPSVKPDSLHGKSFTPITKQSLSNSKLGSNPFGLSTNGFNVTQEALRDSSKLAASNRYGKSTLQGFHPAWKSSAWTSTSQDSFKDPLQERNPLFRETSKNIQTVKKSTKGSGFSNNYALNDGRGWIPDKVLKGDNSRTEYRDRFNGEKDFHRDTNVWKSRKLGNKENH